jgi:hypothetical protein
MRRKSGTGSSRPASFALHLVLISFFALTFGAGAALTGMVLTGTEKR